MTTKAGMKEYLSKDKTGQQEVRRVKFYHAILDTDSPQGEAGARLLVKSPNLSEVGSEWAAMEEELAGAGAM